MELELDGKRALVTAASKGLGYACAERLADEGADVTLCSRSADRLADARARLLDATDADPETVHTRTLDLAADEELVEALETAIEEAGGLDVLVTNHGGPPVQPLTETTTAKLDETYRSVLRSTALTLRTCLPHLADSNGGSVVNVVSATAREPFGGDVMQAAFRPGIYALSRSLAHEWGPDVRLNCACPRGIVTDRLADKIQLLADEEDVSFEEARRLRAAELDVDDLGDPDDFATAVAFLASPAARYITGEAIDVDGGWHRSAF
ncbi:3-oxoacyl-ACP reductase FabG [Halorubrum gandharaense]